MLDPVLLRSFLAVVQTGGFTRAAASLHLTQSTVSQQVRRLEEQLGAELLFQAPHLLADRGLRQMQAGSRAGEATGLHHGEKTA